MNKGPGRKVTVEDMSGALATAPIITPGENREGNATINIDNINDTSSGGWGLIGSSKRKRDNGRNDPRKSRRPELPITGPGRGGRVGASATQHVVQHLVRDTTRDEDVSFSPWHQILVTTRDATRFRARLRGSSFLALVLIRLHLCPASRSSTQVRARDDGKPSLDCRFVLSCLPDRRTSLLTCDEIFKLRFCSMATKPTQARLCRRL